LKIATGVSALFDSVRSTMQCLPQQVDVLNGYVEQVANVTQFPRNLNIQKLADEIPQISTINNSLLSSANSILNILDSIGLLNQQLEHVHAPLEGFVGLLNETSARLSLFDNIKPFLSTNIVSEIPRLDSNIFKSINRIDWNALSFNSDASRFIYDGDEYEIAEIEETAQQLSSKTVATPTTNRANKLLNIVKVIIQIAFVLYTTPPQIYEATIWYKENIPSIIEYLSQIAGLEYATKDVYLFVVNERGTTLRSEPDANAAKVFYLPFDSQLRLLSEAPRWREVEYTKDDGEIIVGWVSKVSVDVDNES
jgi:hypothetical protein